MDHDKLKLDVALLIARQSALEGPYYGPWGIALETSFGKPARQSTGVAVPVIYPQYPIGIKESDLIDADEKEPTSPAQEGVQSQPAATAPILQAWSSDSDPMSSPTPVLNSWVSTPPTAAAGALPDSSPPVERQRATRISTKWDPSVAPLPALSLIPDSGNPNPQTPARPPVAPGLTRDDKTLLRAASKILSTRIPDFARCTYLIVEDGQQITEMRWDLLVEIKKKAPILTSQSRHIDFKNVAIQAGEQADHVFATNPDIDIIGAILALGDVWVYREYSRNQEIMSGVGTGDSTYRNPKGPDSDGSTVFSGQTSEDTMDGASSPKNVKSLLPHLKRSIVVLGTTESDNMLVGIRERLQELNPMIWQENTVPSPDVVDIEMSGALEEPLAEQPIVAYQVDHGQYADFGVEWPLPVEVPNNLLFSRSE